MNRRELIGVGAAAVAGTAVAGKITPAHAKATTDAGKLTAMDRFQIRQALYRYCHTIDHFDYEGLGKCFTPDGFFERLEPPFLPGYTSHRVQGRADIAEWARVTQAGANGHSRHHITNIMIKGMGDGVTARTTSYWFYTKDSGSGGIVDGREMMAKQISLSATSMSWDLLKKIDGAWMIAERWSRNDPQPDKFDPWTGVAL